MRRLAGLAQFAEILARLLNSPNVMASRFATIAMFGSRISRLKTELFM